MSTNLCRWQIYQNPGFFTSICSRIKTKLVVNDRDFLLKAILRQPGCHFPRWAPRFQSPHGLFSPFLAEGNPNRNLKPCDLWRCIMGPRGVNWTYHIYIYMPDICQRSTLCARLTGTIRLQTIKTSQSGPCVCVSKCHGIPLIPATKVWWNMYSQVTPTLQTWKTISWKTSFCLGCRHLPC